MTGGHNKFSRWFGIRTSLDLLPLVHWSCDLDLDIKSFLVLHPVTGSSPKLAAVSGARGCDCEGSCGSVMDGGGRSLQR